MKQQILVIGGLGAGPSAATKAKRTNPNAEVTIFECGDHVSYGICEIPYYIGNVFSDPDDLISFTPQTLQTLKGVQVKTANRVEKIVPGKKKIIVRDLSRNRLDEHAYDKLIVATGSNTRKLGLQGEDCRNVFRLKSLEDGFAIKRFIVEEKPRSASIIGGGYVGMEMAEALAGNGIKTQILHPADLPMDGLEEETRRAILEELARNEIDFVPCAVIREMRTDMSGKVTEIISSKGRHPTDLIILSLGVTPNVDLARAARIRTGQNGGILTDQRQLTSIDSVFAAGDCCEVRNIVNNKWMYVPLATIASRQGRVAGENAAGGNDVFKGVIRAIAGKVFGLHVAQVGLGSQEAVDSGFQVVLEHTRSSSRIGYFPGSAELNIVAVADVKSKRLLGANVFGQDGAVLRADTLGVAIQQKLTLDEISKLDLIYSPPFAPLWDPILVSARQLKKRVTHL